MFKRLRNRFVIINMATTSLVLLIAFSAIYFVAMSSASARPPLKLDQPPESSSSNFDENRENNLNEVFEDRLREDRRASLSSLLISLIFTGLTVELVVLILSFYLADQSIKPVKDAYNSQKTFIANASHEIKTPLAVIQANLEAADISGNPWLDNVAIKVEDLAALNNQLLTLARVEGSAAIEKETTEVDLGDAVKKVTDPFTPKLSSKKLIIKNHAKKKHTLSEPDLRQILGILVDNAIKYSDKKITIAISDDKITVKNDGTTISPEELPHLFERFYQADKTKNGVGLGLAIASELAQNNSWALSASSDAESTTFTLSF